MIQFDYWSVDNYDETVTLRHCPSEPGGPAIELSVGNEFGNAALSKKKARKLALALLKWSESDG